jgi:chromosome segregation ATPase
MCLFLQLQEDLKILNFTSQANSKKIKKAEENNIILKKQLEKLETKLEQTNSDRNDLQKQIDSKAEILLCDNKKKKEMNSTIDGLNKTLDLLNRAVQNLCGKRKDVSARKVQYVTVHSLKYLTQSSTSNLGKTEVFRGNFY